MILCSLTYGSIDQGREPLVRAIVGTKGKSLGWWREVTQVGHFLIYNRKLVGRRPTPNNGFIENMRTKPNWMKLSLNYFK